jgi:hypothetical protein
MHQKVLPSVSSLRELFHKNYNAFGSALNSIAHYHGDLVGYQLYILVLAGFVSEREYAKENALSEFHAPDRKTDYATFKHFYGKRVLTK